MAYGYMDADACRKRHRNYVKQQKRAANKRALRKWRSFEMTADEYYREVQEKSQEKKRQQGHSSASKPQTTTASGWSRHLEEEWRVFQKTYKGKQWEKYQTSTKQPNHEEDPTCGAREDPDSNSYRESGSAKYRRQFWSNAWNSGTYWNFGTNASGRSSRPNSQGSRVCHDLSIGSPADRIALGLAPAGPLSLDDVKLAFRQCALTWHPDRHHGDQKQFAEAKFKRVGDAYHTLRALL